jgi:TPR repeat protein
MSNESRHVAMPRSIKAMFSRKLRSVLLLSLLATAAATGSVAAPAPTLRQGVAAIAREDYVAAAAILAPFAQRGNPDAQTYMGYLYAIGHGVPQDYTQAAIFYRRAAEQGHPGAQYELGLLYDKGQGVPQDNIEAEKWLILAAAGSNGQAADDRTRLRNAMATKLTRGELAQARMRALAFVRHPEH